MAANTSRGFTLEDGSHSNFTFSRLSSRKRGAVSTLEASFRLPYYGSGGGGSVPFQWESQPGTPKHPLSEAPPPPLTPPPSYNVRANGSRSGARKRKSFKILSSIIPIKMAAGSPTYSSSSSSLSSFSYSLSSTPARSTTATGGGDHATEEGNPWTPTLFFRPRKGMKFLRKIF